MCLMKFQKNSKVSAFNLIMIKLNLIIFIFAQLGQSEKPLSEVFEFLSWIDLTVGPYLTYSFQRSHSPDPFTSFLVFIFKNRVSTEEFSTPWLTSTQLMGEQ